MPVVVLLGPDGAGKSTATAILSELTTISRREHYRPAQPMPSRGFDRPHDQDAFSFARALVKLVALWVEQVMASGKRRSAASHGMVVIERGWWDAAVDPTRYRLPPIAVPVVRALGRFLPKADVAIVLVADPVAIHRRKPEIPIPEIERQIETWQCVAPRAARVARRLDTSSLDRTRTQLGRVVDELQ